MLAEAAAAGRIFARKSADERYRVGGLRVQLLDEMRNEAAPSQGGLRGQGARFMGYMILRAGHFAPNPKTVLIQHSLPLAPIRRNRSDLPGYTALL